MLMARGKQMNKYRTSVAVTWLVTILCGLFYQGNCITCPPKQTVERLGNATILCSGDGEINQCYWYFGSTTSTRPILKLENNIKDGTKLHDEHYDITDTCGMKIINAQISQEAIYTFVAFFSDGKIWRQDVSVVITVTPAQKCLRVSTCTTCDECTVASSEKEVKRLTCSIDRIRPAVTLYWHHEGDIKIVSNRSYSEPNYSPRGTWNSSATIEYTLACQENSTLYCFSKGAHISTVQVKVNSECDPLSSSDSIGIRKKGSAKVFTIAPAIAAVVIMLIIWIIKRRLKEHGTNRCLTSNSMLQDLKNLYADSLIPGMKDLYTGCHVTVQTVKLESYTCLTNELMNTKFLSENKRAFFVSDSGYGKTAFFQHLLAKWVDNEAMQSVILIYFQSRFLSKRSNILKEIKRMLPENTMYDVNKILKDNDSLVILDGLNYLDMIKKSSDKPESGGANEYTLTVEDLLLKKNLQFPSMNLWVSSREFVEKEIDSNQMAFLDFSGFKEEERDQFFLRALDSYQRLFKSKRSKRMKKVVTEENATLLSNGGIESMKTKWNELYPDAVESSTISPLVAHLFAFNFLLCANGKEQMITNSLSRHEVLFDATTFKVDLSQVNWHILACLLESSQQFKSKELTTQDIFGGKSITFEKDQAGYQRYAAARLCMMCRKSDVELESLTFRKDYPFSLHDYLPYVKNELTLQKIMLVKANFISLINDVSGRIKTVRFIDCQLPQNLKEEDFEDTEKPSVLRTDGRKTLFFDFEKLTWKKQKAQKYEDRCRNYVC